MKRIKWTLLTSFSLSLIMNVSQGFAAEQDLTRDELRDLLQERDAAIIQLQHTVRDLTTRIAAVEQSISPDPAPTPAPQSTSVDSAGTEGQQGFAKLEVDEQTAQRALERTLVQGGALLMPTWRLQFSPSFSYALNQFDFPALVVDGDDLLLGSNIVERTATTMNLAVQVGLPFDSQLELSIPYLWSEDDIRAQVQGASFGQSSQSREGVGSLKIGLAKTLMRERGWRPDLVGRITWDTGSGDRADNGGIVSGFESVGGSLSLIKRSDPLVFFGSMHYQTFFEDRDIEPGDQFAISIGTALAVSPSSSLFASISNQFLAETAFGNDQIVGSDITAVSLSLGASTIVSRGVLLNLTTGIGISENAPDYTVGLSASLQTDALRNFFYR